MATVPQDVVEAAQASQEKWKIPACISLAQWALESGWGQHLPPDSNNPFGIKAVGEQPQVTVRTREVDRYGHEYFIDAPFRKFDSIADAFDQHAQLLATAPPYAPARACLPDPNGFADGLAGVYATDRTYGKALRAIMQGSDLYRFDVA